MRKALLLIAITFFLSSCELIGPSEEPEAFDVSFRLDDRQYKIGDAVQAALVNASTHTVYRVQASCHSTNVQKRADGAWTTLRNEDIICTAEVTYSPIESGEAQDISLPASWFEQRTRTPAGTYRFSETVVPTRSADTTVQVTSETFTIGEDNHD